VDNGAGVASSTTFSVRIGRRNAARLSVIANRLANRAIAGDSYVERMQAANTLSFIDDPAAIDSLLRVLQRGALVEDYAVRGLGRIGSPAAIVALTGAAHNHADEDVRAAARSTLRMRLRGR
jgi:hypothetical protein